jgi:hypothetical protein
MYRERLPNTRTMKRLILAAAPAAALVAAVALPVAGCGGAAQSSPPAVRAESAGRKLEKIVADNRRPIARLADAVRHADASDPATLVRVRATASLVSERVEQSEPDINRLIALPGAAGAQAAEVQRALDDVRELSYALSARRLRAARIQTLAEEADQSTGELAAQHTMPSVGVETLVDELRDAARRKRRAHTRTRVGSAVVPARVTADAPLTFNTGTSPGESVPAAYCRFETASDGVYCWTPNDGFTLRLDSSGARRIRSDESDNRGLTPGYTVLPLGSSRSNDGYTCTSRASGLTCTSPSGAGWVLPRYRGLPQLF